MLSRGGLLELVIFDGFGCRENVNNKVIAMRNMLVRNELKNNSRMMFKDA